MATQKANAKATEALHKLAEESATADNTLADLRKDKARTTAA